MVHEEDRTLEDLWKMDWSKGMQDGRNRQLVLMLEVGDEAFEINEVEWAHRVPEIWRICKRKCRSGALCARSPDPLRSNYCCTSVKVGWKCDVTRLRSCDSVRPWFGSRKSSTDGKTQRVTWPLQFLKQRNLGRARRYSNDLYRK
jgi:hypothetical protein